MLIPEPIQAAIWHCLNHYAYDDAIFLAERLYAEANSEDSLYLLATCYYRANKRNQCYTLLKNKGTISSLNSRCKFLLSRCCMDMLNYAEAEEILLSQKSKSMDPIDTMVNTFGDSAPFACKLFGDICSQTDRIQNAKDAFTQSLKLNPFLWDSYSTICNMGENSDPNTLFQVGHLDSFSMVHGTQTVFSMIGNQTQEPVVIGCNLNSGDVHSKYTCTPNMRNNGNNFNIKQMPIQMGEELGILHPSNKNRPGKFKNLFSSTPMAVYGSQFGTPFGDASTPENQNFNFPAFPTLSSPFMSILPTSVETSEPRNKKPVLVIKNYPDPEPNERDINLTFDEGGGGDTLKQQSLGGPQTTPAVLSNASQQAHTTPTVPTTPQQPLNSQTANVRRSSRLFSNSNASVKENNKTPNTTRNRLTPSKSPSRKNKIRTPRSSTVTSAINNSVNHENQRNAQLNESTAVDDETNDYKFITPASTGIDKSFPMSLANVQQQHQQPAPNVNLNHHVQQIPLAQQALNCQKQASEWLMSLFREMGIGYQHLCKFECQDAVDCLNAISSDQFNTGWILGNIAKAYFEVAKYDDAIKYYTMMREKEPYRVEGLEWLSTALWHMQKEVELSSLAHDLMSCDRKHVSTWITAGNCFSLHKEHETAIKFFKRAIQVKSNCSYAYTLLGHEYVATEELEKAMRCFRNAARINPRHYNAWYGIGMIFYKQERFQRAEVYYRKSLAIHPNNSVLLCHLGVVLHAQGRTDKALATLSKALKENSNNPLCKFHRASILFAINRLDEALRELEELKQIVPKESLVYFLIAKIYSKKGDTHKALLHFSWATDLDPKGANNQIKESIEPVLSRSITSLAGTTIAGEDKEPGEEIEEVDETETDGMEVSNDSEF